MTDSWKGTSMAILLLFLIVGLLLMALSKVPDIVESSGLGTAADLGFSHGNAKHGTDADKARNAIDKCLSKGGSVYEVWKPDTGNTVVTCQMPGGKSAVQVFNQYGKEVTAFITAKNYLCGLLGRGWFLCQ